MAENDYKEIDVEEKHEHAESGSSEGQSLSLADLIRPGSDTSSTLPRPSSGSAGDSGSPLSNILSSLPELRISGPTDSGNVSGSGTLQDVLGGKKVISGESEQGVLRTLSDLLSNGATDNNAPFRNKLEAQAKISSGEVQKALQGLSPELQKEYKNIEGAKGGYSDQQLAFIKQHAGLDAYNSARNVNEMLQTIRALDNIRGGKKEISGGESQQGPAEGQDSVNRTARPADGQNQADRTARPAEGADAARREYKDPEGAAKQAYGEVKKAISQLPEKLQNAFAQLPDSKQGTYTNEQLAFIKQHAGLDAYKSANTFNDAMNQINRNRVNGQPAEGHNNAAPERQGQAAQAAERAAQAAAGQNGERDQAPERQREMQSSEQARAKLKNEMMDAYGGVKKAVADMKPALQEQFHDLKYNKDGSYSKEQLQFLKDHSKEGYLGAQRYNAASDQLNQIQQAEQRVNEAKPDALQTRLGKIKDQVAQLPKELQKEFAHLPMYKDGVGYNQAHVDFLREHVSGAAAQAMKNYINDAREAFWNRLKK